VIAGRRVLVTGGSGFIGANLMSRLLPLGCRIRATLHERPAVIESADVEYVAADLTSADECRRVVEGIDVVFMCAASTSGAAVIRSSPLVHVTPNVIMNAQMLDAAYRAGVKKFVFISSSIVYPPNDGRATREDDAFTGDPPDVYYGAGWMKRSAEALCRMYAEKLNPPMATLVVRPSNCYGPYDKFDPARSHVTAALVRRVVDRETPLVVWGTGDDVRDLLFIDDFIDGMLRATALADPFLAVNLASGGGVSVKEILATILRVEGWRDADIRFDASRPTTIASRLIDVTLARERLGFTAPTRLEDGLARTVDWYRTHRAAWTK
jgi:GDP-L-fucose synthase